MYGSSARKQLMVLSAMHKASVLYTKGFEAFPALRTHADMDINKLHALLHL